MSKGKKVLLWSFVGIGVLVVAVVLLISPLTKYLIEKHDVELSGREITLDWAYVNPFTGYVYLDNLAIFEQNSDSVFLSADGLMANLSMFKLLTKTYEISAVKLTAPRGIVHQVNKVFNFQDIITKFSSDSTKEKSDKVTKFNLLNIEIEDGEFHYIEDITPINYFIKNVNITSDGLRYDADTMPIEFSLFSGPSSGKIAGKFAINRRNSGYALDLKVDSFDLDIINQYAKDLTNYGSLAAILDAELHSTGNFKSSDSLSSTGRISISDFKFGRTEEEDFASFDRLVIAVNRLSPKDYIYHYDSVCLTRPFIKYEKYDELDNFQTLFGKGGQNVSDVEGDPDKFNLVIEIAHLIGNLSRNFLKSQYQVGRVAIYDGDIQYDDYSMGEKFSVALNPFTMIADSVDKRNERVYMNIYSGIKPHGDFRLALNINPKDSSYFNLNFGFQKLALSMMNPFLVKHTGFPLDRGAMELNGDWNVINGQITSTNHLIIVDPRVSKRVRGADTRWLPMKLAMAIVKEKGNVIDYEVPITGNLGDPAFDFWDVITDIFLNIILKPATTAYRIDVRNLETEIEKSQSIKWEMGQSELSKEQRKYIKKIIQFLKSDPGITIAILPKHFADKEKELILLFEAKKLYYLTSKKMKARDFTENDSFEVTRMSIKDEGFNKYLNSLVKDKTLFTVQGKAIRVVGVAAVEAKFQSLLKAREAAFKAAFIEEKVIKQLSWKKDEELVPFNGFSYYEISYKNHFPDYLKDAFEKMHRLNMEMPRDQYQKSRRRNRKEE